MYTVIECTGWIIASYMDGVVLEKLTRSQLVKNLTRAYRTKKFITVFTSASHYSPS